MGIHRVSDLQDSMHLDNSFLLGTVARYGITGGCSGENVSGFSKAGKTP